VTLRFFFNLLILFRHCDFSRLLLQSFARSTELLLKSYEEYLKQITPAPQYLPVTVDILIIEKKIKIQNVLIKAVDSVKDLKRVRISCCVFVWSALERLLLFYSCRCSFV
jgi:hypothetical protein